jgi:HAMP domain-containing protein
MLLKPKSSSAQLRALISDLQSADKNLKNDPNVEGQALRELRHALDNLRLTAWTVSELQNARNTGQDARAAASFLTAERLRRIRQMIDDLSADLEHDPGTLPANAIGDLQASIRALRDRLDASVLVAPRISGR